MSHTEKVVDDGIIFVNGGDYSVYNMAGMNILRGKARPGQTVAIPSGVYVIETGTHVLKAVVR